MISANEARKMYLDNYDRIVKYQTKKLIKIIENSIIYACEHGEHHILIDIKTYDKSAIQNVEKTVKEYGYSFSPYDDGYIKIFW